MDARTQEVFDKILKKAPFELTPEEIGFLRARRSCLKPIQLEEYKEILNPKPKVEVEPEVVNQTSEKTETVKANDKSNTK